MSVIALCAKLDVVWTSVRRRCNSVTVSDVGPRQRNATTDVLAVVLAREALAASGPFTHERTLLRMGPQVACKNDVLLAKARYKRGAANTYLGG